MRQVSIGGHECVKEGGVVYTRGHLARASHRGSHFLGLMNVTTSRLMCDANGMEGGGGAFPSLRYHIIGGAPLRNRFTCPCFAISFRRVNLELLNPPTRRVVPSAMDKSMDADPSSSVLSSAPSFVTAKDSKRDKSTAASSPAQDNLCPYREARRLPRELKEHCQIFLEEQLCRSYYR